MAAVSLFYGAFNQPLEPYMHGFLGGILEAYRAMRDIIFSGVGVALKNVINTLSIAFEWIPPWPWIQWRPYFSDLVLLCSLTMAAIGRMKKDVFGQRTVIENATQKLPRRSSNIFLYGDLFLRLIGGMLVLFAKQFALILLGVGGFFALVFAENQIGL